MPDSATAFQLSQHVHVENFGNQAHALVLDDALIATDRNPAAFLPPVLQGIKTEIRQCGRIRMSTNAKQTTGFPRFVIETCPPGAEKLET
jgi:hypothetical protein